MTLKDELATITSKAQKDMAEAKEASSEKKKQKIEKAAGIWSTNIIRALPDEMKSLAAQGKTHTTVSCDNGDPVGREMFYQVGVWATSQGFETRTEEQCASQAENRFIDILHITWVNDKGEKNE